jgi:hypothetical protein
MEFKGRISAMFRDMVSKNWNLTISTDQDISESLQIFSGKELDVKLKQHREKRSLDANAYYWCLLTKLAKVHGWTNVEAHNRMLREYGQFERVEGQLIAVPLPDTDQTEKEVLNKMEYHLALSPKITVMKGQTKRVYLLLRGSSTYNTEEMARLISGLIEDCRDSGIPDSEIMTPFEKQKLFEQYGIGGEHEQKDKSFAVQTRC